ncbi:MAG: DNA polymerase III subunit gamma/tau [Chloroflexota bacterium]
MASQVFYRRWRPQSLSQVAGQEAVTRTLLNALTTGRIAHAYLFCGPRGTGKTSTGRILAKAVNCLNNSGKGEPCNKCAMCQAIGEGRALDVIEIDAASNTGVDNIRDLRERVGYSPAEARYKVYIIGEVHMLSNSACNALLKTLEEPPPHIIFVLATTEPHKLLPTIVSRCQRFDFRRIAQKDIITKLTEICGHEGISIGEDGLRLISRSAQGSLRDAENILEQLTTYYGHTIGLSQVEALLGITQDARVKELLRHIVAADIPGGIATINSVAQDGLDLKQFNRSLVSYLRGLLLAKTGGAESQDFSPEDLAELKSLADKATLPQILCALRIFGGLEFTPDGYSALPLEMAFIDATVKPEEKETRPPAEAKPKVEPVKPVRAEAKPVNKVVFGAKKVEPEAKRAETVAPRPAPAPPPRAPVPQSVPPALATGSELERLQANWRQILAQAPPDISRAPAVAILRSAGVRPVTIEGDSVVLAFRFPIHMEKVSGAENQKIVEKLISGYLGRPVKVRCVHEPEANHLVQEAQKLGAQITSVEEK